MIEYFNIPFIFLNQQLIMNMQSILKEYQLLKGYVGTLQKENQARNAEKNTLFNQIDRLTAENQHLNDLLAKSRSKNGSGNINERDFSTLKQTNISLEKDIQNFKSKISQLESNLCAKQNQLNRLNPELQRLKQSQTQSLANSNKIILLEKQMSNYKAKISQITTLEQNIQTLSNRNIELESNNRRLESNLKSGEQDYKKVQSDLKKLEAENRELKISSRSSSQLTSLLSTKLGLQASVRQLNARIQWLETSNQGLEQQKQAIQSKLIFTEKQLFQTKGKMTQMRYNEQAYNNSSSNNLIKQKEALEQMISSLKQNKKYLEKTLKEKQQTISDLQSQLYTLKGTKFDIQTYQRQLSDLRLSKIQLQSRITLLSKTNDNLSFEIQKFNTKQQGLNRQIDQLKSEKSLISTEKNLSSHNIPERGPRNTNDSDLRLIVERLRDEIEQIKATQTRSQISVQETLLHHQSAGKIHPNNNFFRKQQTKSPVKVVHSKIVNQKERNSFGKHKWQNLQKKINALRSQNQHLKNTLFD